MQHPRALKFALFSLCVFAQLASFSQKQPTRTEILRDVQEIARRHAESGAGKDNKYALDQWEQNPAGVSRREILRVYDEEYTKVKSERDKEDWKPKAGWIVAGLLAIGLFFLDRLKKAFGNLATLLARSCSNSPPDCLGSIGLP